MTQEEYRAAVDAVEFDPDFSQKTLSLLEARQKERTNMKKIPLKTVLIAAALMCALAISATAAYFTLLSPADVANHSGYDSLAAAFQSEDAISVNETKTVGDYNVTFMGLASGKDLAGWNRGTEMSCGVLAVTRVDGQPITSYGDEEEVPVSFTPLVEGYAPWLVNNWTLGGGWSSFCQDGVLYFTFASGTLEPFADHSILLAVYPGVLEPPSAERFAFGQDGSISYQPGREGVFFSIPLDPAKADPQKVQDFMDHLFEDCDSDEPAEPDEIDGADENSEAVSFAIDEDQDGKLTLTETTPQLTPAP